MDHKSFPVETKAEGDAGEFTALVSVFNNVDLVGDRVKPGAFQKSIEQMREKGDPLPIILSHQHDDIWAHIGAAQPENVVETAAGLQVTGKLDIADNPVAKQTYKLMKERRLKEFSFGYSIPKGGQKRAKDGANDLTEINIFEAGPTLKGANPDTALQAVKSALKESEYVEAMNEAIELVAVEDQDDKAVWSTAFINNLPDSAFLYIEPGGEKDDEGKTTPRSLRHFPYKGPSGSIDMPHLRNAMSRIPQSNLSQEVKDRLMARCRQLLDQNTSSAEIEDRKDEEPKKAKSRRQDPQSKAVDSLLFDIATRDIFREIPPVEPPQPAPPLKLPEGADKECEASEAHLKLLMEGLDL